MPFFFLTGSLAVSAQDGPQELDSEDIFAEEIVVLGFKSSLNSAVNAKRFSRNITDHIFAEEIGKSADQNIAEALSRITGISLNRSDGEGSSVSIRGAAPNLNNISINGIVLTSGGSPEANGDDSSQDIVDLSAFSSDILAGVDIYKTASADLDEGSLGGTVVIRTVKPLDERENRRSIEVQSRFTNFSDGIDYSSPDFKVSANFSQKFMDDTIGIHTTIFSESQGGRRDQVSITNYEEASLPSNLAWDQFGNSLEKTDSDGNIELVTGLEFSELNVQAFDNERERVGGTFGFQYSPSSETDIFLSLTHSQQSLKADNDFLSISASEDITAGLSRESVINFYDRTKNPSLNEKFGNTEAWLNKKDPDLDQDGNVIDGYKILPPSAGDPNTWIVLNTETGLFDKRLGRYGRGSLGRDTTIVDTDNTLASLNIQKLIGDVTLNFKLGYSKTETEDDLNNRAKTGNFVNVSPIVLYGVSAKEIEPVGWDCTSGKCKIVAGTGNLDTGTNQGAGQTKLVDNYTPTQFNPDDAASHHLQFANSRDQSVVDEAISLYFDIDWDVNSFGFTTLESGIKVSDREKDNVSGGIQFQGREQDGAGPDGPRLARALTSINATEILSGDLGYSNFLSELGYPSDNITNGWPSISAEKAFELAKVDIAGTPKLDRKNTRNIRVSAAAVYFKGNFAYLNRKLRGDIGVRYVATENEATGVSGIEYGNNDALDLDLYNVLIDSSNPPCVNDVIVNGNDFDTSKRDAEARQTPCFDEALIRLSTSFQILPVDITTPTDPEFSDEGSGSSGIVLPSVNINFDATDNIVLRTAASKTMARPTIDSLQPGFKFSENIFRSAGSGSINNTDLQPLESKNFDLAFEYYFNDDGGVLGLNYFYKDYANFEEAETISASIRDLRGSTNEDISLLDPTDDILRPENTDPAGCFPARSNRFSNFRVDQSPYTDRCRNFQVTKTINGKGGIINGIEVNYQQNYEMLPGFWSHLGSAINFTFQKTEADRQDATLEGTELPEFPIAFSPEKSLNATIFWEKDGNLVRLAYSYASDILINRSFINGLALWQRGEGSLDLSATWRVNNNIDVTLNAVNLSNRVTRQYVTSVTNTTLNRVLGNPNGEGSALDGATKARTYKEFNTGSIYRLGVRVKF